MNCTIIDCFEIFVHWEIIVTTHYTFKDQNDYYPIYFIIIKFIFTKNDKS